jgi:raffinose/stachyose/melibiose transport system permease protein
MSFSISRQRARREWRLYLLLVPSLGLVGLFLYLPALSAVYHSFFNWTGSESEQFVGLDNFRRALRDQALWSSFVTVGILILFNVVKMAPAMVIAVLIHRIKSERWQYLYRALLVVPLIVPTLVSLFIWKFIFDSNLGLLNQFLDATGLKAALVAVDHFFGWDIFFSGVPIGWLSNPSLILPSLFLFGFPWVGTVGVLLYLSGLQNISPELYEAAELDGAGPIKKFFHIELPLLLTQVRVNLLLLIIGTLQGYGLQLLLLGSAGGAGARGMVPGLWMFNRAFIAGEFGYACAVGMIIFLFIVVLTVINNRYVRLRK